MSQGVTPTGDTTVPPAVGCGVGFAQQKHCCPGFFNIASLVLMIYTIIAFVSYRCEVSDKWGTEQCRGLFFEYERQVITPLFGVFYLFYLCEALCSATRRYLSSIGSWAETKEKIDVALAAKPELTQHISCYHYETRTRTVNDGDGKSHTETYQERVTTYSESQTFPIGQFGEIGTISDRLDMVLRYAVAKLSFEKIYQWNDDASRALWEKAGESIKLRNRHRDTHMDYNEGFQLPGFEPRLLCVTDPARRPFMLQLSVFWLCTFFFCSWAYRVWLDGVCAHFRFTYVKAVSADMSQIGVLNLDGSVATLAQEPAPVAQPVPNQWMCSRCNIPQAGAFCGKCGSPKPAGCPVCHNPFAPGAAFCAKCGTPATPVAVPEPAPPVNDQEGLPEYQYGM